jgi:hypothetical protein
VKSHPLRILLGLALLCAPACREQPGHAEDQEHGAEGHDHEHGGETAHGARFKAGKGITLSDEVRKLMELQTTEAALGTTAPQRPFHAQVYRSGATSFASAILPVAALPVPSAGAAVSLKTGEGEAFTGIITAVHTNSAAAFGGIELLLEVPVTLPLNSQLRGELASAKREAVQVPEGAILRTVEGAFVYVQNGAAYRRTAVQTGGVQQGMVEVVAGLPAGAEVVAYPVQTLWLIELRAVKGGGHSH